jgi:SAM-dependent methyltransferase
MHNSSVTAQQAYWDDIYSRFAPVSADSVQKNWLGIVLSKAEVALQGTVLEIGCGRGVETAQLVGAGRAIVSFDLSLVGLKHAAVAAPPAHLLQAALPDPLPFRPDAFDLVVAGLSLHYFGRRETDAIIAEIRQLLKPSKALAFQVNAAGDTGSGYGKGEEIEPGVFAQHARYKRFFTEQDCVELFGSGWRLMELQPLVEHRYGTDKQTWVGAAIRTTDH